MGTAMSLTKLEAFQLKSMRKTISVMTSAEALQLAVECEEHKLAVGPFDPAFGYFASRQDTFEKYALLLEKEEQP